MKKADEDVFNLIGKFTTFAASAEVSADRAIFSSTRKFGAEAIREIIPKFPTNYAEKMKSVELLRSSFSVRSIPWEYVCLREVSYRDSADVVSETRNSVLHGQLLSQEYLKGSLTFIRWVRDRRSPEGIHFEPIEFTITRDELELLAEVAGWLAVFLEDYSREVDGRRMVGSSRGTGSRAEEIASVESLRRLLAHSNRTALKRSERVESSVSDNSNTEEKL